MMIPVEENCESCGHPRGSCTDDCCLAAIDYTARIRYRDEFLPLPGGRVPVGVFEITRQ
jgi:hypothetical protein